MTTPTTFAGEFNGIITGNYIIEFIFIFSVYINQNISNLMMKQLNSVSTNPLRSVSSGYTSS